MVARRPNPQQNTLQLNNTANYNPNNKQGKSEM